jgi:hypothetical protein
MLGGVVGAAHPGDDIHNQLMLAIRDRQVLAFSALSNAWSAMDLRARERVVEVHEATHVAVVVTNFRILGFSAVTSQWSSLRLESGERPVEIRVRGMAAKVITNFRALGFGAEKGVWAVLRFKLK